MQIITSRDWAIGINALQDQLMTALHDGKRVLWLFSGGSNIKASVQIMQAIPDELTAQLTVMPLDERYGEPGHSDSNYTQLLAAGFAVREATMISALGAGLSLEAATTSYSQNMQQAFANAHIVIGQLGIGEDGHIAGILPGSPAASPDLADFLVNYVSPPYQRMTPTFNALKQIDKAYTFAFGEAKKTALDRLKANQETHTNLPSAILYELPESYLYTDQIEGN